MERVFSLPSLVDTNARTLSSFVERAAMKDSLSIGDFSDTSLLVLAKSAMELCVLPLDGMCVVVGSEYFDVFTCGQLIWRTKNIIIVEIKLLC